MKLDLSAIESYGHQYATKVCDDFFNRTANGVMMQTQTIHLNAAMFLSHIYTRVARE